MLMHRRQFIASLPAVSFTGCQAYSPGQPPAAIEPRRQAWNQYRGGPGKQGYTSRNYSSDASTELHLDYRLEHVAIPVLNGREILIPTPEYVVALNASDRTEEYRIPIEQLPTLPPAVSSNVLLLVTGEGLHGYDLHDHSLKWTVPASRTYTQGAAPVGFSEHFVVQDGNRLRCLEDETGSTTWEHSFDARLVGFAATHETVVVLRRSNHTAELIGLETDSGSQKWRLETDPGRATPVPGTLTYSISDSGRLIAIQNGEVVQEVNTGLTNPVAISMSDEYVILGPDESDWFVGINKVDQTEAWRTRFEFASPPLVTSGSVFVPTANDGVITVTPGSGEQQRTYSEARFIEYLLPYERGILLSRQTDNRIGFMDFAQS